MDNRHRLKRHIDWDGDLPEPVRLALANDHVAPPDGPYEWSGFLSAPAKDDRPLPALCFHSQNNTWRYKIVTLNLRWVAFKTSIGMFVTDVYLGRCPSCRKILWALSDRSELLR